MLAGAALEIGEDLLAGRGAARPLGVGVERERVEGRRNVAGEAGVGVVAPDAADRGGLLEDGERVDPCLSQLDSEPDAAEAGADDRDRRRPGATRRFAVA